MAIRERLIRALKKREEEQKALAYPKEGEIWKKFKDIAMFSPEAAEKLTTREQEIRQAPYEATKAYREEQEQAETQITEQSAALAKRLASERKTKQKEKATETARRKKAEATLEISREEEPLLTERQRKLRLQKQGLEKYYKKPKGIAGKKKKKGFFDETLAEKLNRLMKRSE